METAVIFIVVGIIQLAVIYFIIKSASRSDTLVEQNEKMLLALRTIAKNSINDPVQIYNLYSPSDLKAQKTDKGTPEEPVVDVNLAAIARYKPKMGPIMLQELNSAWKENKTTFRLSLTDLYKLTSA